MADAGFDVFIIYRPESVLRKEARLYEGNRNRMWKPR